MGLYLNDEWRPASRLTVNLGLRWDAELNTLSNDFVNPWASDATLRGIPSLARWLNTGNRRNDLNNFSPRLSFSWDPTGGNRTFVRGGYAIMYDRVTSFIGFQERLGASWRTYNFVNPGTTDVEVLRQRVRQGVAVTPSPVLVKDLMRTPENRQWSIGVGHQLTPEWALNVDWIQQDIRNLYVRVNPNFFDRVRNARALTPAFGDIVLWDDFGRAKFRALISQLTYAKGQRRASIAWTLSYNNSDFDGNLAAIFPQRASYQLQRAAGDERHRVLVSTIQPLPWRFLLSSIVTVASPRAVAVTDGRDLNLNNVFVDDFIEVFNLLNSNNWSTFGAAARQANGNAIASFMQPTNVFAARQAQLGVRAEF
ncbi:MAG: TonB-dependent receptor [Gemmatimonadaceae bacterium]|nr:TonB-dependent receptor [Gemmatimonadaceae bacterium]